MGHLLLNARDRRVCPAAAPLPTYVRGPVDGVFGTLVHQIALRALATRLAMAAGLLVFTEERLCSGPIDLVVFLREPTLPRRGEAQLYELVPDHPDYTEPYVSDGDRHLDQFPDPFNGLRVTNASRGRVLTHLRAMSPGLFEPLLLRSPAVDLFVRYWPAATTSGPVNGLVGYDWGYNRQSDPVAAGSDAALVSPGTGLAFGLRGGPSVGTTVRAAVAGTVTTLTLPAAASSVGGATVRVGAPGLIVAAATIAQDVAPLVLKLFNDLRPVVEPLRAAG
jgi:hypothetical protein